MSKYYVPTPVIFLTKNIFLFFAKMCPQTVVLNSSRSFCSEALQIQINSSQDWN